ncbi:type IV pilus modification PilV family protein [Dethiothermospora halolimnae]|uniref:type IV pilus modification PilV family protein n=1 Tax=Dethiothermospora halolimnae TaxID=3114390 RepID=UPI003CCB7EE3
MNKTYLKDTNGFTLVEMVVSFCIISIIIVSFTLLIGTAYKIINSSKDSIDINNRAESIMENIKSGNIYNGFKEEEKIELKTRLETSFEIKNYTGSIKITKKNEELFLVTLKIKDSKRAKEINLQTYITKDIVNKLLI